MLARRQPIIVCAQVGTVETYDICPRPEFRQILFEIWVASAAGLRPRPKVSARILLFSSPTDLPSLRPQPKGLRESRDHRWPSPAAVCNPHACSDAAEPISRSTRLHSRPLASGSLPTPPLFLNFVHFLLKNTLEFSSESSANLGLNQANL